jgi:hypothetical protein
LPPAFWFYLVARRILQSLFEPGIGGGSLTSLGLLQTLDSA